MRKPYVAILLIQLKKAVNLVDIRRCAGWESVLVGVR
jgi:hypothetical protein